MRSQTLFVLFLALTVSAADVKDYIVDSKNATSLVSDPSPIPVPTRVDVRWAAPKRGLDETLTPFVLGTDKAPSFSSTNQSEITNLISMLGFKDSESRLSENQHFGATYHLFFFQDANQTVIHYRVFEPLDTNTMWCLVYPRTQIGTGWFNEKIGPWLHAHLKTGSNSVSTLIQTNKP